MASERTVKTLTALLAAMTAGAFALMLMESDTVRRPAEPLAAYGTTDGLPADAVPQPEAIALQKAKWDKIIVHSTGAEGDAIAQRCHFVIAEGPNGEPVIHATELWHNQMAGNHVHTPDQNYNADSIGICLLGDYTHQPPTEAVFEKLIALTTGLQRLCDIESGSVFLFRSLAASNSPGRAFPARAFEARLLIRD
jgi:hypothetical protein